MIKGRIVHPDASRPVSVPSPLPAGTYRLYLHTPTLRLGSTATAWKSALTLGRHGYYHAGLGRNSLADEQLSQAIQLCRADTASALSAQGYLCLYLRVRGDLHVNTGRLQDALGDYREVLAVSERADHAFLDYEGHALRGLGDLHRLQHRHEQAQRCYHQAQRIADDAAYSLLQTEVAVGLARLALAQDDLEETVRQARRALHLARGGWLVPTIQAHLVLAKAQQRIGDTEHQRANLWRAGQLIASCNHHWSRRELTQQHSRRATPSG